MQAAAVDVSNQKFLKQMRNSAVTNDVFYKADKDLLDSLDDDEKEKPQVNSSMTRPSKSSEPSILSVYYSRLGKSRLLTPQEEREIFLVYQRIKRKVDRYKVRKRSPKLIAELEKTLISLRNIIVERNLKFVIKLAKSFWLDDNVETFENLISAGNIGLIRAIDRFDVYRRIRFLTYASNWIALEIRIELSNDNIVKVPIWWQKTLRKIQKAYVELAPNDEKIKVADLAKKAKIPVRHTKKLSSDGKTVKATDIPPLKANVPFLEEVYPDHTGSADTLTINQNAHELIMTEVMKLNKVERLVIISVFGLDGEEPKNLRQISNILGNTGERVRQLKEKGLETLRRKIALAPERGGLGLKCFGDIC
jgi:RNA polymerase primary sigma factor